MNTNKSFIKWIIKNGIRYVLIFCLITLGTLIGITKASYDLWTGELSTGGYAIIMSILLTVLSVNTILSYRNYKKEK